MQSKVLVLDSIATEFRLEVLFFSELLHNPAIAFAMDVTGTSVNLFDANARA